MIATEGEERFAAALQRDRPCPRRIPQLAFVLSAMAGHLFGYEAALAIDAQARPLREARAAIEAACRRAGRADDDLLLADLRPDLEPVAARFFDGLRSGSYDGHLEASTAVRLASLFRYALGIARSRPTRPSSARSARPARRRRPHRCAHRGHRGAHPAGRRHQAPGQDRHGRHLPQRRDACCRSRWCARCWPPAPPATASATGRCARSPTSIRRWPRSLGFTRYRIEGRRRRRRDGHDRRGRPGRHRPRPALPHRADPAAAGHQAPGRRGAGGHRGAGPQRRPHGRDRARGEGRPGDGLTLLHVRFRSTCPGGRKRGAEGYRGRSPRSRTP